MIQKFVDRFEKNKHLLRKSFKTHPDDYKDLVTRVIEIISHGNTHDDDYEYPNPDPKIIHSIDDGDYQGTLIFIIPEQCYQPDKYYYVKVSYGSCSGCDTLQAINGYGNEEPREDQVNDYMTLALHIVQQLKKLGGENV